MENTAHRFNGEPLDPAARERLLALVHSIGERQTITRVGISRQALTRALAGLGIYPPTRDAILRALGGEAR